MYDFSKVEPATASAYLEPGIYEVRIKDAKSAPSKQKGTAGFAVTFENKEGQTVIETFYVTDGTQERLQYLHSAWLGKKLEGKFKTEDDVVNFFIKALLAAKKVKKTVIVAGQIADNGTLYSKLPYSGFVVEDPSNVELGAFDTDSKEYKKYVTTSNLKSEVAGKKNGILNEDDEDSETEEIGTKKPAAKVTTKTKETAKPVTKGLKKITPPVEEEEVEEETEEASDDLDW
jgi:hypothetical protein